MAKQDTSKPSSQADQQSQVQQSQQSKSEQSQQSLAQSSQQASTPHYPTDAGNQDEELKYLAAIIAKLVSAAKNGPPTSVTPEQRVAADEVDSILDGLTLKPVRTSQSSSSSAASSSGQT